MSDTLNDLTDSQSTAASATLERAIAAATDALLARQRPDGHWVFELEADATIPAEYVLLRHYLAEPVNSALEAKVAAYLRRIQGAHGGWPLFRDGDLDVSATVKAYFALKMIGNDIDAAHMAKARASEAAWAVTTNALQVFGGIGFTWEHDIHLFYKRLLSVQQYAGGSIDQLEELATIVLDAPA